MGIILKHRWLVPNILKWQDCKIFTKLVPSQTPCRSSQRKCFVKKIFINIYKISRESTSAGVCFIIFIKNRLHHRCFSVKFAKFLRRPILKNISERLLLPFLGLKKINHNDFVETSYNNIICERRTLKCETFFRNWSPLKMMKNAFYFILKALFVLKISKFLSSIFSYAEKMAWLERKG